MAFELKVPEIGESITEVQLGDWLKAEGEAVRRDEGLVVIETDKATVEMPSPVDGTITRIVRKAGERANVGDVIAILEEGPARADAVAPAPSAKPAAVAPAAVATAPAATPAQAPRVMPAAARAMAKAGVTVAAVTGTGPGGRVLKEDVDKATDKAATPEATTARSAPAPAPASVPAPTPGARLDDVVPMSPIRRRIAERLVAAQHGAALLTTFNEIDMTFVMELRRMQGEAFLARHGVKLGFMSFFVKAAVDALKAIPQVNAEVRGESIVFHGYWDIGVAIGGGKGLVVPVLRDADLLGFAEIEKAIADFGARAKANKLELHEIQGGTFTISNGGVYGSLMSTPIVNPPQSGVLGLHAIQDRPVAREGQVVIRPMMYVALTYDHRVVDGREAVTFLKRIKDAVEDPALLLLEL